MAQVKDLIVSSNARVIGNLYANTQSANDNSTKVATTAYVDNAVSGLAAYTAGENINISNQNVISVIGDTIPVLTGSSVNVWALDQGIYKLPALSGGSFPVYYKTNQSFSVKNGYLIISDGIDRGSSMASIKYFYTFGINLFDSSWANESDDIYVGYSKLDGSDGLVAAKELMWLETTRKKVTSLNGSSTNDQYPSAKTVYDALQLKENTSNKVTSLDDTSTDTQYPSAKATYDLFALLATRALQLCTLDAQTNRLDIYGLEPGLWRIYPNRTSSIILSCSTNSSQNITLTSSDIDITSSFYCLIGGTGDTEENTAALVSGMNETFYIFMDKKFYWGTTKYLSGASGTISEVSPEVAIEKLPVSIALVDGADFPYAKEKYYQINGLSVNGISDSLFNNAIIRVYTSDGNTNVALIDGDNKGTNSNGYQFYKRYLYDTTAQTWSVAADKYYNYGTTDIGTTGESLPAGSIYYVYEA